VNLEKEVVLPLHFPRIPSMSKLKILFICLILSGNLLDISAQKKFFTCYEISVDEFHALQEAFPQIIVLDVRSKTEYLDKHIPWATWVPSDSALISMSDTIDADQKVIIYDDSGDESIDACLLLASKGKRSVYHVKGGFEVWEKLGYRVKKAKPKNK
jgi:rhodanese-related sulfurtransferase